MIEGYCAEHHLVQPTEWIYEAGDPYQKALEESLRERRYPTPVFKSKKDGIRQFEACDFLAYEMLHGIVFDVHFPDRRPVKGTMSAYLDAFRRMPGLKGIYTKDNLPKLRMIEDTVLRLQAIKKESEAQN